MMCDFRAVMDYICIAFVCVREADQTAVSIQGALSEDPGIGLPSFCFDRPREIKEVHAVKHQALSRTLWRCCDLFPDGRRDFP